MKNDQVDRILQQWERERSDLDTSPMAITGRIMRISICFKEAMENTFRPFGLNFAGFDLLATLLRSGSPYTLSPGELLQSTMVTSGTLTNRIDRLEKVGLVSRTQNLEDKRSYMIGLTDRGYNLINEVLEAHVKTLHEITESISARDRATLSELLQKITASFEG
ncbi:MAG: MarR family winged helix-turn-helix transcriptional regulator [Cellvibrionaceae bacterium]